MVTPLLLFLLADTLRAPEGRASVRILLPARSGADAWQRPVEGAQSRIVLRFAAGEPVEQLRLVEYE